MDNQDKIQISDPNVKLSKKTKITAIVSIAVTTVLMFVFLAIVVLTKNMPLILTFMFMFMASCIFEFVMCIILVKYAVKKYLGKSNAL